MSSGIPWWRCILLGMLVRSIFQCQLLLRIVVKYLLHANHEWMESIDRGSFFLRCNIYPWITARTCFICPKGKNLRLRPWFHGWGIVRGLKYGSTFSNEERSNQPRYPRSTFSASLGFPFFLGSRWKDIYASNPGKIFLEANLGVSTNYKYLSSLGNLSAVALLGSCSQKQGLRCRTAGRQRGGSKGSYWKPLQSIQLIYGVGGWEMLNTRRIIRTIITRDVKDKFAE